MGGGLAGTVRQVSPLQRSVGAMYALCVAVVAGVGFVGDSTSTILLAAVLSLPASMIAVPGYYLAYGLLALVPGANPSGSSGSASCTAAGECNSSATGGLPHWFVVTTDVVGVLALTCAALVNVLALRILTERRRGAGRV